MSERRYWAVVPAAGVGRRMHTTAPKQYLRLAGCTVIEHTLDLLLHHPRIRGVVVAISVTDTHWSSLPIASNRNVLRVTGGAERAQSVLQGLQALHEWTHAEDWVLVHDAVRPCLQKSDLDTLILALEHDPVGGLLATPVRDTMKRADAEGRVKATEDRSNLWHAQTPQMFRYGVLTTALQTAIEQGLTVTDEASAVEAMGLAPRLVAGRADNIKITRPEDLALAKFYLAGKRLSLLDQGCG